MRGCVCATCEGQRAYGKRPEVKARHVAESRALRAQMTEEQHARQVALLRARRRAAADQRDADRINQLRRAG